MDFITALGLWPHAPVDEFSPLLETLSTREQAAIHGEPRLEEPVWQSIFLELSALAPGASADEVRLAFSAALENVLLCGTAGDPIPFQCERAVPFEGAIGYYIRELMIPRLEMEENFDFWSDPDAAKPLDSCCSLLGHFKTGPHPSWAIPFASNEPNPLDGHSAETCHQRLALYPDGDHSPKVIMTYILPPGTKHAVPTIGDAFRWNDAFPYWRSFFLPAPIGASLGKTAPLDNSLTGFDEIVHEPIDLINLTRPLQRRL